VNPTEAISATRADGSIDGPGIEETPAQACAASGELAWIGRPLVSHDGSFS
jgi:hypothetical protein